MAVPPLVVGVAALVLAVWATVRAIRDQPVIFVQLKAAAVIEVLLLVLIVVALATGAGSHHPEPVVFWGYLVTALIVLPLAGAWAFADRTRWSSVVLLVGAVAVAAMQLRVASLWTEGAGS